MQLTNAIEHTNIANTFEPLQPVYDTDLDGFNRHEHEQVILSMIEESRRETLDDFQRRLGDTLHHDWQRQKRRLVEELGEHQPDAHEASALLRRSAGAAATQAGIADDTPNAALLHGRMVRYDTVVARMNRARAEHEPTPVVHAFMETVESMVQDASRKRALLEAWTVLKHMVRGANGERSCAAAYLDLDAFREGHLTPVFFGSALRNFGVRDLIDALGRHAPSPRAQIADKRAVEADEPKMTGFVFKIQANMDPKHRDRVAFVRLASGHFERGMKLTHVRSKKPMAVSNPVLFLAADRELAEEAWAGDIIGIPNHMRHSQFCARDAESQADIPH